MSGDQSRVHYEPPHDQHAIDVDTRSPACNGLSEGTDDDDDEFNTVHPLPADMIGEITEEELSEEGTDGVGNLDAEILVRSAGAAGVVDVTDHRGGDGNGKNIVGVSEKPHA